MKRKTYKKLVRDNIPKIIELNGGIPHFSILENKRFIKVLGEKLIEEGEEVRYAKNKKDVTSELADVLQVVESIAKFYNITPKEIQKQKKEKEQERGGFSKKIFLEYVDE